ncbi:MAG: endolytic transglycosylase MltG [Oscillospiraceae bacterium]|jgi:UPF0755 protein|nr:endolytic transglycosylase MltG [Oscillospiraceae bacterium]
MGKRSRWKPVALVFMASFVIAWIIVLVGSDVFGFGKGWDNVEIEVKTEEADVISVSKMLKKNGVIKSRCLFVLYEFLFRKSGRVKGDWQTGKFLLNRSMGFGELIRSLTTKPVKTVTVEIIPGTTSYGIAKQLEEKNVCSKAAFLDAIDKGKFNREFLQKIPKSVVPFSLLEGYLFPDKFEFYEDQDPMMVIEKFFDAFEKKVWPTLREASSPLTTHEIITIASIVEKEAGSGDGTEGVAAVFVNRLRNPQKFPRLESDATLRFYKIVTAQYPELATTEREEAYNSYVAKGVILGPICSPSRRSIEAVLHPPKSEDFFFVSDKEGKIYFAETFAEHRGNVKKVSSG